MQPILKRRPEFDEVLATYKISDRAKQTLEKLQLVLLIAPSSTGRNTIIRHQLQTDKYYFIVSDTTRPPRANDGVMEQDSREYWFRTEDDMLKDLQAGEFLEAELLHKQQVSGISIRELEKAQKAHKVAITDVDIEGIHNVKGIKPDTFAIMLLPPSFEEWQKRMNGRGVMPPEEQLRRMETAARIFQDGLAQDYYQFVITENIEESANIIDGIVRDEPSPHQERARSLLQNLSEALAKELS